MHKLQQNVVRKKGYPLYMLHGWGLSSVIFEKFAKTLSKEFSVRLIDLPGYGHNHTVEKEFDNFEELAETVASAMEEPGLLLGWSLGGMLATYIAATYPHKVNGLITIASNVKFTQADDWPHAVEHKTVNQFSEELEKDYDKTIDRFIALTFHGSERQHRYVASLKKQLKKHQTPRVQAIRHGLSMLKETDLRPVLSQIRCPVKQIFGEKDTLVPNAAAKQSQWLFPGLNTEIISKAGHAPFLSHAEEVSKSIETFYHERIQHTKDQ